MGNKKPGNNLIVELDMSKSTKSKSKSKSTLKFDVIVA
jgi:hypothetical protein